MSAPSYMIAVESYGSQRVRAPASGAMLSAYKIGYSTVGRAVLLALYGSRALDVTSKHASYHYVSLEGDVSAHNGYLLLALTENIDGRKTAIIDCCTRPIKNNYL